MENEYELNTNETIQEEMWDVCLDRMILELQQHAGVKDIPEEYIEESNTKIWNVFSDLIPIITKKLSQYITTSVGTVFDDESDPETEYYTRRTRSISDCSLDS